MSIPPSFGRGGRGAALAQLLNQQVRRPGDQTEGVNMQPNAFGIAQTQQQPNAFGAVQTQQHSEAFPSNGHHNGSVQSNGTINGTSSHSPSAGTQQMMSGNCQGMSGSSKQQDIQSRSLSQPMHTASMPVHVPEMAHTDHLAVSVSFYIIMQK